MHSQQKKTVAIVVPLYKPGLTQNEEISLKHLKHYLNHYDKFITVPDDLDIRWEGFKTVKFPASQYGTYMMYNKRMLSKKFYESFCDYRYILIYHLDALVFSDQLIEWCAKDYDYIGAPWYEMRSGRIVSCGVGNGGFSLRKVESALKVLNAYHHSIFYVRRYAKSVLRCVKRLIIETCAFVCGKERLSSKPSEDIFKNFISIVDPECLEMEDSFWAYRANDFVPDFNISPPEVALSFSFEIIPRYCFELNKRTLPFGCHGWYKYDRKFWEPFLLK